jgi:predicted DCC family thiol-disulfide oxidoreductase YuxK
VQERRHLILYDGVCGLCNRFVALILPRDSKGLFHYAWLQSQYARSLLSQAGEDPDLNDTIYVIADYNSGSPRIMSRARAALFIIGMLDSPWRFLKVLELLPTFVLDAAYGLVARHRYRLFGKHDTCLMPNADYANRFVDR